MTTTNPYDLVVIGGGSGGSACARRAAKYGAKVALIECGPTRDANGTRTGNGPGGTCVNVGCVPKKVMFEVARQREGMVGEVATAGAYSLSVPEGTCQFDWAEHKARRDGYVGRLVKRYAQNWKAEGITLVDGMASFESADTVVVHRDGAEPLRLRGHKVLIACGGEPDVPSLPGAELAITSDGFFDLETQPAKVAVVGGGYIAVELAGILHALGSETHLLFRGDSVLRHGFDPFVTEHLMTLMQRDGPHLHPRSTPTALSRAADGSLTLLTEVAEGGGDQAGQRTHAGLDCVLFATGRRPKVAPLNLANAGVVLDPASGRIVVDDDERTSVPNVFAIGDATTAKYDLTPVAIAAGRRLADRLFGSEPKARLEYSDVASVVFSHPPLGTVGLTEPQAIEQFGAAQVRVQSAVYAGEQMGVVPPKNKVRTAIKLVLQGPEERVVGLHCIGQRCDEMVQGFAVALKMGATRADFEAAVAIHPTEAEEFVTFGGWGQATPRPSVSPRPMLAPYTARPLAAAVAARRGNLGLVAAFAAGVAVTAAVTQWRSSRL